jgi:hypothetical protein
MYEDGNQKGALSKISLARVLMDAMSPRNDTGGNVKFYADWGNDLESLLSGMSEMVFAQVSPHSHDLFT